MQGTIRFSLVVLVAATLAGGAAGKAPPEGIEICGQGGCKTIAQSAAERVLISLYGSDTEPAAPAPYFLIRWRSGNGQERAFWLPMGRLVRAPDGHWSNQRGASEAVLREAAAGLTPFATPVVTRAVVGRRIAENPQSYLRVLRGGRLASRFHGALDWIPVRLASLDPSPWTNGATWIQVSRTGALVRRDAWIYRVPQPLVERARRGLSLTPFSRPG